MRPNLPFLSAASNALLKPGGSADVEGSVSERRKAFAAAHRSDEDRQDYISASRNASSVIAKAKDDAWQTTSYSFSRPNLTLNLCTLSFVLSLALLLHLPFLLTSPTIPLPRSRLRSSPIT